MPTLTNVGTAYDTATCPLSKELGLVRIDFTGVTQLIFDVFVNKVGTGTQSWQVWNESDGAEIGVINDAAAAGVKTLSATFNVNLSGQKLVRIRAKSSVSTDDPVFFSASLMVK